LHKITTYGGDFMQMIRAKQRFFIAAVSRPDITLREIQPQRF
jgi:hypothetical protein